MCNTLDVPVNSLLHSVVISLWSILLQEARSCIACRIIRSGHLKSRSSRLFLAPTALVKREKGVRFLCALRTKTSPLFSLKRLTCEPIPAQERLVRSPERRVTWLRGTGRVWYGIVVSMLSVLKSCLVDMRTPEKILHLRDEGSHATNTTH